MRVSVILVLAFAAAGCVAPRPRNASAPPVAAPAPRPVPAPTLTADWRDWPVSDGTWSYRRDDRGSVAMYGRVGADAIAVLRCDIGNGRVFLSLAGTAAGAVTVSTSSAVRSVQAGATGGTPPYVAVALMPTDPLLDALAFSRGRFALSRAGAAPVVLPAWAEVGRVVEDCRP